MCAGWRAPETFTQGLLQEVSLKADVYMYGCFMFECMTGRIPYHFNTTGTALADDDRAYTLARAHGVPLLCPLLAALPDLPTSEDVITLRKMHPSLDPLSAAIAVDRLSFVMRPSIARDMLVKLVSDCLSDSGVLRPDMGPAVNECGEVRLDTVLGRLITIQQQLKVGTLQSLDATVGASDAVALCLYDGPREVLDDFAGSSDSLEVSVSL